MFEKIREIIAEQMNVNKEDITLQTRLVEDLKADSIDAAEMILNIESELNVLVPDDAIMEVKTVEDIIKILEKC